MNELEDDGDEEEEDIGVVVVGEGVLGLLSLFLYIQSVWRRDGFCERESQPRVNECGQVSLVECVIRGVLQVIDLLFAEFCA